MNIVISLSLIGIFFWFLLEQNAKKIRKNRNLPSNTPISLKERLDYTEKETQERPKKIGPHLTNCCSKVPHQNVSIGRKLSWSSKDSQSPEEVAR